MTAPFRRLAIAFAILLTSVAARAGSPTFSNIDQGQFDSVVRDVSADLTYSTVTPASSMGNVFGFEFGVIAGVGNTPNIDAYSTQADPNASVKQLANAAVFGALGIPGGLTFEALFTPSVSVGGVSFQQFGGAVKWTLSDEAIPLPFSMAVKGFYTSTKASFSQFISSGGQSIAGDVELSDAIYGLQLIASKDFLFVEPYIGVGYVRANGSASVSAPQNATIFAPSFTSSQSATDATTSTELIAGLEFKLLIVRLGAEYSRLFDTDRFTAKLSLAF